MRRIPLVRAIRLPAVAQGQTPERLPDCQGEDPQGLGLANRPLSLQSVSISISSRQWSLEPHSSTLLSARTDMRS